MQKKRCKKFKTILKNFEKDLYKFYHCVLIYNDNYNALIYYRGGRRHKWRISGTRRYHQTNDRIFRATQRQSLLLLRQTDRYVRNLNLDFGGKIIFSGISSFSLLERMTALLKYQEIHPEMSLPWKDEIIEGEISRNFLRIFWEISTNLDFCYLRLIIVNKWENIFMKLSHVSRRKLKFKF